MSFSRSGKARPSSDSTEELKAEACDSTGPGGFAVGGRPALASPGLQRAPCAGFSAGQAPPQPAVMGTDAPPSAPHCLLRGRKFLPGICGVLEAAVALRPRSVLCQECCGKAPVFPRAIADNFVPGPFSTVCLLTATSTRFLRKSSFFVPNANRGPHFRAPGQHHS